MTAERRHMAGGQPNPDDLLVMLAVARLGKFSAAADALGVNSTTASRRIAALEKAMGGRVLVRGSGGWELTELGRGALVVAEEIERSLQQLATPAQMQRDGVSGLVRIAASDGFAVRFAVPALARLQENHPRLSVELISATRRVRQNRSGVDLEIVAGRPDVHRAIARFLTHYHLGLYASESYLARHGSPAALADLADHRLIYYIESALQVDELDLAAKLLPQPATSLRSTSVFAHVEATVAAAGIGILPVYLADERPELRRLLRAEFDPEISYWSVAREESLRSNAVRAVLTALRAEVESRAAELRGRLG
ncbi:LysR family transcriptional regulator [Nocardia cyriacigeorgica]|uniref:LysR family transcriptional regulator n=1 Tax=Nocardia cyriacigeorgica TaxID=135487 RepID=UPI0024589434|nr:LysR family transcriptional regulator [Nocardia cyriacigeorgica]